MNEIHVRARKQNSDGRDDKYKYGRIIIRVEVEK